MNNGSWYVRLAMVCAAVFWLQGAGPVRAQDGNPQDASARLDRLEHRVNQLAGQQQGAMNQRGGPAERPGFGPMPQQGPGDRAVRGPEMAGRPQWLGPHAKMEFGRAICWIRLVMAVTVICHVLLAIWVYTDIRKRGEGNGIFIVLALLAGFFGAGLYALTRIGERKA